VSGDTLLIGTPGASNQFCADPPGIMEQETAFLSALASASSFSLEGGQLYVTTGGGLLEFVQQGP
jgi:heat shock protein HslJ